MIILNLEANNLLSFQDFSLNFSYPKKIVNSSIEGECFETKPNFRYKKVLVLMGANASGKTSIGRLLLSILNFINKKEAEKILKHVKDPQKETSFSIDFALNEEYLYRVSCKIMNKEIDLEVFISKINKADSYEKCCEKLKPILLEERNLATNLSNNYINKLEQIPDYGWLFTFPGDAESRCSLIKDDMGVLEIEILENVLKTLDTSIVKVEKSNEVENSYIIRSKNGDVFVQNGEIKENNLLSSGTKAGIEIAYIISSMKKDKHGFYYCDERFSYIQSDVEVAALSLMIQILPKNSQLFFTTHNLDILDMNLPIHSFIFLKKKDNNIIPIDPKTYVKKNDVSLRNLVKNDVFDIAPNLERIFNLEEEISNG